jgi:hypothetical protein
MEELDKNLSDRGCSQCKGVCIDDVATGNILST